LLQTVFGTTPAPRRHPDDESALLTTIPLHNYPSNHSNEQTRQLLALIRRKALFSLQPAPPTKWRYYERFTDQLVRQRIKTVTHVVELLNFVQDRIRMHEVRGFIRKPKGRKLQMG
jgi:hypothetical protein